MDLHYLSETHILLFLLQVAILLGCARLLGDVFRRFGQPSITAEILVGLILGPTLFGRFMPEFHARLFPPDEIQKTMLETVAWLGILFFLLKSGLETNFATAWRQRRHGATLSLCDLTMPMLIAFIPSIFLAAHYFGGEGTEFYSILGMEISRARLAFTLFISVIMTISAMPVTARVLMDLKVYRSDLGLLIMSALTINDVAGWIIFALILGFFTGAGMTIGSIVFVMVATLAFAALCLSAGPRAFDWCVEKMDQMKVPEPSGSLTLVCIVGLLGGAVTTWIGIHALFGFFIVGIMAGESRKLSEHTRHVFSQLVNAILVPLFFASIGLKLDFVGQFDLFLVLFLFGIGLVGRYIAAYIGSRLIGQSPVHGKFIALAHIPGGEMQIVIGMVALQYAVISETTYVAIVFGAIATSIIAGPWMRRVLLKLQKHDWLAYLTIDSVIPDMKDESSDAALIDLCHCAMKVTENVTEAVLLEGVRDREKLMGTALGNGVAVPHVRLPDFERPIVLCGRSLRGIEWDAPDGQPVHLIFMILTPKNDPDAQLQILRGISTVLNNQEQREALMHARDAADIIATLRRLAREGENSSG